MPRLSSIVRRIALSRSPPRLVRRRSAGAQQPRITNGRVTTQPAGRARADVPRRWSRRRPDIAWIGYAVPVVDGERTMCCFESGTTWINGIVMARRRLVLRDVPPRAVGDRHVDDARRRSTQAPGGTGQARRLRTDGRAASASSSGRSNGSGSSRRTVSSTPAAATVTWLDRRPAGRQRRAASSRW